MITKQPKLGFVQILKKSTKAILIFEGALFLGSYGIWYSMNTSQDFRYYMYQRFPSILETYYIIGEKLSGTIVGGGVGYVTLCSIKPDESELIKHLPPYSSESCSLYKLYRKPTSMNQEIKNSVTSKIQDNTNIEK
ncbi:hypothetical protein HN011_004769 [Eciton burchellii]|nr:hypothetical protein HN011_004769 [Eciton burchellii]